jgi:hypothetical protein
VILAEIPDELISTAVSLGSVMGNNDWSECFDTTVNLTLGVERLVNAQYDKLRKLNVI